MQFSDRISGAGESKTARFIPLINKLKQDGIDVINLAIGEPEYESPAPVIDAVKKALENGQTRYGPVAGLDLLKERLAEGFQGYTKDNIIVSNGSKQILYSIFQVILNPGDEVIIPRPSWVSFSEQIRLAGGIPVFVDTHDNHLDIRNIEKAVSSRTRAVLINSPNNPTGAVYPFDTLEKMARIAVSDNLWVISDEAYDFFVYDDIPFTSPFAFPHLRERLVVTRSFSKHFSMTGFRVGYAAAPIPFIRAMTTLQSHLTGNVCSFAQYGALSALDMDNRIIKDWRMALTKKRDLIFEELSPVFDCIKPEGAFYLFPDISRHLNPNETSADFAARILEKTGVAVVPGEDFGKPGHVRISFAVPHETLVRAIEKIKEVL